MKPRQGETYILRNTAWVSTTCCQNPIAYVPSADMAITHYNPPECKGKAHRAFGPIPNNQNLDISCPCPINTLHCVLTRTVIPTTYPNTQKQREFVQFSMSFTNYLLEPHNELYTLRDLILLAEEYIDSTSHPAAVKEKHR